MRIKLTSVFVSDQERALQFCTEVLKTDIPMGKGRWLTVVSREVSGTLTRSGPGRRTFISSK